MTEKSLLEFIAQQVGYLVADMRGLRADVESLKADVGILKADVAGLKADVGILKADVESLKVKVNELQEGQQRLESEVKKINNVIENDIKPKIQVLFDGYVQNSNRLNRVEAKLKHVR